MIRHALQEAQRGDSHLHHIVVSEGTPDARPSLLRLLDVHLRDQPGPYARTDNSCRPAC